MPKLSKLSITITALMLAVSPTAFAQDDTPELTPEVQTVDSFTSADIDSDGALDRDEFVSFVVMKMRIIRPSKFPANMIITLTQRIIMLTAC